MLYALSLCVLFLSGHPLTTLPNNFWFIAYVIALSIAGTLVIARGRVKEEFFLNRFVLLSLLIFFTLIYGDVNLVAIKFILFFILGLVITMIGPKENVLIPFAQVNYHLMVLSLACYFLINLGGIGIPGLSFSNVNDVPYRSILFYNWFDSILIFRNTGFYWEPGLLATHAILTAVVLSKYNLLSTSRKIFIFLVLISTFSIFGIVMSLFLISKKKRRENVMFFLIVIGFACFLEFVRPGAIVEYIEVITRKFFVASASVSDRVSSQEMAVNILMDNFLGVGIGNFVNEFQKIGPEVPFTSSVIGLGASYPAFGLILSVALLLRVLNQGVSELKIIIVVLLAANKEPLLFSMIIIVICLGFSDARHSKTA